MLKFLRKLYHACYGLNRMSPVSPIHMEIDKAYLRCDATWRWGLWEIIRFRRGPEGGALMMDLIPLPETPENFLPCSLPCCKYPEQFIWGHSKKAAIWNPRRALSQDTNPAGTSILDFQSPEMWEINSFCLHHPVYEMFLWQHKGMKTLTFYQSLRPITPFWGTIEKSPQEFQCLSLLSFPAFSLAGWWAIWG